MNIPEVQAATGAAVKRAIASALSGQPDVLLAGAECENEEDVVRRIKLEMIRAREAMVPGFGNGPDRGWGGAQGGMFG